MTELGADEAPEKLPALLAGEGWTDERAMLQALARARSVREVLLINGRESGSLTRALAGESPGTRIYRNS